MDGGEEGAERQDGQQGHDDKQPTVRLKERGSYPYLHTLRELFGLDPAPPEEAPAAEVTRLDARRRRA